MSEPISFQFFFPSNLFSIFQYLYKKRPPQRKNGILDLSTISILLKYVPSKIYNNLCVVSKRRVFCVGPNFNYFDENPSYTLFIQRIYCAVLHNMMCIYTRNMNNLQSTEKKVQKKGNIFL